MWKDVSQRQGRNSEEFLAAGICPAPVSSLNPYLSNSIVSISSRYTDLIAVRVLNGKPVLFLGSTDQAVGERKKQVDDQASVIFKMFPGPGQVSLLVRASQHMVEYAARFKDQPKLAVQLIRTSISQHPLDWQVICLLFCALEHTGNQVKPYNLDAILGKRDCDPTCAATELQNRAAKFLGD